jgi:hypothetical protein
LVRQPDCPDLARVDRRRYATERGNGGPPPVLSILLVPAAGLGLVRGKAHRPSATERPSWSHTTALVAVVEESMPMAYVGKRISGHAPEAGGLSVSALLHVVSGGGDVLPPGYELT